MLPLELLRNRLHVPPWQARLPVNRQREDWGRAGDGRLSGKGALVTGGGQGIGGAIARNLAGHGAAVWIGDIQEAKGAAVAQAVGGHFVRLDVTDPENWSAAVAAIGGIDI